MILPDIINNTESLLIEIGLGVLVGFWISKYFDRKQQTLLTKIHDLTAKQSELVNVMEKRRKERIRWFKYHSLTLLKSVKERYKKLSAALDNYVKERSPENLKIIEAIATTSLQLTIPHAQDLIINRELPNAAEYIENPWIIAKLADYLYLMGDAFGMAKNSPSNIANIRDTIDLCVKDIDFAIEQINNERE